MDKNNKNEIILRQITDHLFQSFERIDFNIDYIVFLRKNSKIKDVSEKFYITQIDRFSRDTVLTFDHILSDDKKASTLQAVINKLVNNKTKKCFDKKLKILREEAKLIKKSRNKIIAHHNTNFNAKFGDCCGTQLFNYIYPIDPCFCMNIKDKLFDFFGELKEVSSSDGVGGFHFGGSNPEKLFKKEVLGKSKLKNGIEFTHKCNRKNCLLK